MLADLLPLMIETVEHWKPPPRDLFGRTADVASHTVHRAKVVYGPTEKLGPVSRDNMPDSAATVWLIDHPRTILIGDTFKLPAGDVLKATRIERRMLADAVLIKVYLQ